MNWTLIITSFRRLKNQRQFSILNMVGLTTSFTFLFLIILFVKRELYYDRFHVKSDSIFMMDMQIKNEDGSVEKAKRITIDQVDALKTKVSGIKNVTFLNYSYFDEDNGTWLKYGNNSYQLLKMAFTNAAFADIFSFSVTAGSLREALDDPESIVLTQDNAIKIFGKQNPIGKTVLINNKPVYVKAIVETNPSESSIRFDGLINYKAAHYLTGHPIEDYSNIPFFEINADVHNIESTCLNILLRDFPPDKRNDLSSKVKLKLYPLKDSYFSEGDSYDPMRHGNKSLVWLILALGILILILAIINYMNLFFANSFKQYKELAIRSITGAKLKNLILPFLFDGVIISLTSFAISLLICSIALHWFNNLIDYPLEVKQLFEPGFIIFFAAIAIVVGLISGTFPALKALQTSVINLLKSSTQTANKYTTWRHLVLFQMIISIILIISTLTIIKQISFTRNIDMGFTVNNMVTLPVYKLGEKKDAFLKLIMTNNQTQAQATSSTYLNTFNKWGGRLNYAGREKEISYHVIHANADFAGTLNIKLFNGRNFFDKSSDLNSCIINETVAKEYGLTNPLSAKINGYQIVGVVRDFHIQSLYNKIGPVVIFNAPFNKTGLVSIRFFADNKSQVSKYISYLKTSWESFSTGIPFEYEFLDQRLKNMYDKDFKLMKAISSFTILAILIACLGLFGLISFVTENKTKEIGIRKVNGAKISEVLIMLNKGFIKRAIIAFIIASPLAYYAMNKWLQDFAYKTDLSWWVFASAGIIALIIALLTVSWQSWRAAARNPVESLRYE